MYMLRLKTENQNIGIVEVFFQRLRFLQLYIKIKYHIDDIAKDPKGTIFLFVGDLSLRSRLNMKLFECKACILEIKIIRSLIFETF